MTLFHHISFPKVDPLGDGLREEIAVEQVDPITLTDGLDDQAISDYWQTVAHDVESDPDWVKFEDE